MRCMHVVQGLPAGVWKLHSMNRRVLVELGSTPGERGLLQPADDTAGLCQRLQTYTGPHIAAPSPVFRCYNAYRGASLFWWSKLATHAFLHLTLFRNKNHFHTPIQLQCVWPAHIVVTNLVSIRQTPLYITPGEMIVFIS